MLRGALAIALIALIASACSSSREAMVKEGRYGIATYETRDSVKEEVMVAVHDTIMETTTITIQQNEAGDTLKLVQITDRTRASDRAAMKEKEVRVVVKTDTVFIEKRDSVDVKNHSPTSGAGSSGGFVASLRWVFWIIVGIGVLIIIVKIKF